MPKTVALLAESQTTIHACENSIEYFNTSQVATEEDWHAEYLTMEIAVKLVTNIDNAIKHIEEYGSGCTGVVSQV